MADEKANVSPEEKKAPEAPAPSGPGDPPALEHTEGPAVPGGDQAAPTHVGPATPEQSVIPGMGEGKLNGDVIDGILSEEKKEDRGVIISTAELSKYFGKEVTPAKMKEQIMALLDEWKEKQPPELAKPDKKKDLEK